MGSTESNLFCVGKSGGRPTGSTEANGFDAGKAGGRPIGTTKAKGYGVGLSGGMYGGIQSNKLFKDVELPDECDTSTEIVNVDDYLLQNCASRIVQQRTFDLLLGSVIPVVGFYGILVMPTILALLHLLVE
jgi:hypothetical protein